MIKRNSKFKFWNPQYPYNDMIQYILTCLSLNSGYQDNGDYWRSKYETDDFQQQCQNLYEQLKPLYQNLHAYVKAKLMDQYGRHNFPLSGHIPAHILGKSLVTPA